MSEMNDTSWQDSLEDHIELRDDPSLKSFKTIPDLAKSYVELKAYQGRSMKLPDKDATPEEKSQTVAKLRERGIDVAWMPDGVNEEDTERFWRDLGVPEDMEGYTPPADFDGDLSDEHIKLAKETSKRLGHTKAQHENMLKQWAETSAEVEEQNTAAREEHEKQLKQHWGGAYEENVQITDAMVKQFQDDKLPLGELNNAARIFMLNVAKAMSSDPQVFAQINEPRKGKTPAELRLSRDENIKKLLRKDISPESRKALMKKQNDIYEELAKYQQ